MRTLLALLAVFTLAGCQVTVLENAPTGATNDCPAEWRGGFAGVEPSTRESAAFGVFIDEACKFEVYDRERSLAEAPRPISPKFFPGVVLIESKDVAKITDARADQKENFPIGWLPFAWQREDDELKLDAPDHRRIATLIVNGALDGETHWWSADSGANRLRGDADKQAQLLSTTKLFARGQPIVLRHVADERKEFERALERAHRKAKE